MAHLYPSLFSFYLLGTNDGRLKRKLVPATCKNAQQPVAIQPATLLTQPIQSAQLQGGPPKIGFSAQKQFLDFIEELCLFTPCQATLKSIVAYGALRAKQQ